MAYEWVKAIHIIAVICWMAALLYLPRLFVYHCGAKPGSDASETFKVMERKLVRGIMNPSAVLAIISGLYLAFQLDSWSNFWFILKIMLVILMIIMHFYLNHVKNLFYLDRNYRTHRFYRMINEAPALLMVGIVLLVVIKPMLL